MSYLTHSQKKLVVALSSSISGEGKTFCSINLASIYAISGKKCLLVGLDLRKPRIASDFNLVNDKGISTYLSRDGHWKPMIKPNVMPNLDVLLSGPIPPNPSELILQEKFVTLISELKEEYDIIVLDCPPVGLVSETLEIFKHSDINIMILRQEYSEKSACDYINSLHEQNGVKKLYTVLNSVVNKTNYGGYGKYGYGSSYGYGQNGYGYHEENIPTRGWKKLFQGSSKK
jgi:capsular exopolysaccharide synthesis family protein